MTAGRISIEKGDRGMNDDENEDALLVEPTNDILPESSDIELAWRKIDDELPEEIKKSSREESCETSSLEDFENLFITTVFREIMNNGILVYKDGDTWSIQKISTPLNPTTIISGEENRSVISSIDNFTAAMAIAAELIQNPPIKVDKKFNVKFSYRNSFGGIKEANFVCEASSLDDAHIVANAQAQDHLESLGLLNMINIDRDIQIKILPYIEPEKVENG